MTSTLLNADIAQAEGRNCAGTVVVVAPDQYITGVFPLNEMQEIESFLHGAFPRGHAASLVS